MIVFHILGLLLAALIAWTSVGWWIKSGNSTGALYGLLFAGLLVAGIWIARKQRRAIDARNKQYKEQQRQRLKEQGIQLSRMDHFGLWLDDQSTTRWEKRLLNDAARNSKPPIIEAANRRMNRFLIRAGLTLFVLGLIFPASGTEGLGAIGALIDWAAATVPSIAKAASISPMPQLVKGYLGALVMLSPILAFTLIYQEPLVERFKRAFARPGAPKIKNFFLLYIVGCPLLLLLLWSLWTFPGEPQLGLTPTRGQMVFHLMMTSRIFLSIFGTFITLGVSLFVWVLAVAIFAPIIYLTKQRGSHGSNTKRR